MAGVQEKTLASRLAYERLQADKMAADVKYALPVLTAKQVYFFLYTSRVD